MKKGKIYINAPIGRQGITEDYISSWINWLKNEQDVDLIVVYINSPGGDYFTGVGIYNLLLDVDCEIRISGRAASAAAFIAMAANPGKLFIAENSFMVVHNAWIEESGSGDYKYYEGIAKGLEKIGRSQIEAFAKRTGKTEKDIEDLLNQETTMNAKEAVDMGFADEFVSNEKISREEMAFHREVLGYNPQAPQSEKGNIMNKEMLALLGLEENATEEQITAALKAQKTTIEDLEKKVKAEADPDPKPEDEVKAALDKINARLDKADATEQLATVAAMVDKAITDFKILPKARDMYILAAQAAFDKVKAELDGIKAGTVKPGNVQTNPNITDKGGQTMSAADYMKNQGRQPVAAQAEN